MTELAAPPLPIRRLRLRGVTWAELSALLFFAVVMGLPIVFLLIGILGYVPATTPANGMLLRIFHVNTAHNIVHLASGVVFLLCGIAGAGRLCDALAVGGLREHLLKRIPAE